MKMKFELEIESDQFFPLAADFLWAIRLQPTDVVKVEGKNGWEQRTGAQLEEIKVGMFRQEIQRQHVLKEARRQIAQNEKLVQIQTAN